MKNIFEGVGTGVRVSPERHTAIVYNSGWYIYNFRRRLIDELRTHGHRVTIICPPDPYARKLEALGIGNVSLNLSPVGTHPLQELRSLAQLFLLLKRLNPDYVLSFTIKCNLYTGLCRRLLGFSQIANISGLGQVFERRDWIYRVACILYRGSMHGIDRVFFQNAEDRDFCIEHGLTPREASQLLPGSGVDIDRFMPHWLSMASEPRRFIISGRLIPRKGFDDYLCAARRLRDRYGGRVECWILGAEDKGRPESQALRARIEAAAHEGVVRFLGFTDDVRPVLDQVHVVVLPSSYNEGVPRSLLEALASGKPIITTDWRGCRETVRPGENGILIPVHDPDALFEAMDALVQVPLEGLVRMGTSSRSIAESKFDERIVIDSYLNQVA